MKARKWGVWATGLIVLVTIASVRLSAGENRSNEAAKTEKKATKSEDTDKAAQSTASAAPASRTAAAPADLSKGNAVRAEAPGVTLGFEERLRFEGYNNADFNTAKQDRLNQLRTRMRAYADVNFGEYFEGYVRMGWEGVKRYDDPSYPKTPTGSEQASPFTAGELWFDSAYVLLKKFPGVNGLSMQAGRFDLVKGDGWLFNDPSALDGTRTGYDNVFDLSYRIKNTKFEVIGIDNTQYDEFFHTWNKQPIVDPTNPSNNGTIKNYVPAEAQKGKQLQEWNQEAIGLYYTNREWRSTDIEAYTFFNKSFRDIRKPSYYMYLPDRHYTLFGGRVVHRLKRLSGLSVTGEFAYETGTQDSMSGATENFPLRAWGGYGYAKQRFKVKFSPYVAGEFVALSGQDPNSRTVGSFEALFGRSTNAAPRGEAPAWSEFYIYSLGYEEGSYYWTNLKMAQVESGFTPWPWLTLVGGYAHLDAMYPYSVNPYHAAGSVQPAKPAAGVFGTGTNRGQLAKARLMYRIRPNLGGYINVEKFFPGDFYQPQDTGYWFRMELVYRMQGFVPFGK